MAPSPSSRNLSKKNSDCLVCRPVCVVAGRNRHQEVLGASPRKLTQCLEVGTLRRAAVRIDHKHSKYFLFADFRARQFWVVSVERARNCHVTGRKKRKPIEHTCTKSQNVQRGAHAKGTRVKTEKVRIAREPKMRGKARSTRGTCEMDCKHGAGRATSPFRPPLHSRAA